MIMAFPKFHVNFTNDEITKKSRKVLSNFRNNAIIYIILTVSSATTVSIH